ncbi:MAG: MBL fold metallo-hydrolase [Anaerolineae bacterium]|nr:MBL fold metallo-hydrolase [Anaerolineae bacterium]
MKRELTQLYPKVWRLTADNPSPMTGPGTNTYLIGQERLVIIDPGPADSAHQNALVELTTTWAAPIEAIIVTHHHSDHSGGAESLAHRCQVPLLSFGQPLQPEAVLEIDDLQLVVKHTPGHIQAHLCLWLPEPRLLIAGDLVAGQGTILIIPPDGDMTAYLASLATMKALNPAAILPGHGPVIENGPALLQSYIDHRLQREQQVLAYLAQGYQTAPEIAGQIYADHPPEVQGIATMQIEAHLEKLRREGRA